MQWAYLLSFLFLVSCSSAVPFLLPSGGTNVAANTQLGKENRQQVVSMETRTDVGRDQFVTSKQVETQNAENISVVNFEVPNWMIFLLVMLLIAWSYLLWMLPSPDQIFKKN